MAIKLYKLLPAIIRIKDELASDPDKVLEKLVELIESQADIADQDIADLAELISIESTSAEYLSYISATLGTIVGDYSSDSFRRWLIQTLVSTYKIKGTHHSWDKQFVWLLGTLYRAWELWKTVPQEYGDYSRNKDYTHTIKAARFDLYKLVGGQPQFLSPSQAEPIVKTVELLQPIHVRLRYLHKFVNLSDGFFTVTETVGGSLTRFSVGDDTLDTPIKEHSATPVPSCQSTCENFCQTAAQLMVPDCATTCQVTCEAGCETTCEHTCENTCQHHCQLVCQASGCEYACEQGSCTAGSCQLGSCQGSCTLGSCQAGCTVGCEASCEATGCEISCQGFCENASCETSGCELGSCQAGGCEETPCALSAQGVATSPVTACQTGCEVQSEVKLYPCQVKAIDESTDSVDGHIFWPEMDYPGCTIVCEVGYEADGCQGTCQTGPCENNEQAWRIDEDPALFTDLKILGLEQNFKLIHGLVVPAPKLNHWYWASIIKPGEIIDVDISDPGENAIVGDGTTTNFTAKLNYQPHPGTVKILAQGVAKAQGRATFSGTTLTNSKVNHTSSGVAVNDDAKISFARDDSVTEGWYKVAGVGTDTVTLDSAPGDGIASYEIFSAGEYKQVAISEVSKTAPAGPADKPAPWIGALIGDVDPTGVNTVDYRSPYTVDVTFKEAPPKGAAVVAQYIREDQCQYVFAEALNSVRGLVRRAVIKFIGADTYEVLFLDKDGQEIGVYPDDKIVVQRAQAPSAIGDTLNVYIDYSEVAYTAGSDGGGAASGGQLMKVVRIGGPNHLICHTYDAVNDVEGDVEIKVALPWFLRQVLSTRDISKVSTEIVYYRSNTDVDVDVPTYSSFSVNDFVYLEWGDIQGSPDYVRMRMKVLSMEAYGNGSGVKMRISGGDGDLIPSNPPNLTVKIDTLTYLYTPESPTSRISQNFEQESALQVHVPTYEPGDWIRAVQPVGGTGVQFVSQPTDPPTVQAGMMYDMNNVPVIFVQRSPPHNLEVGTMIDITWPPDNGRQGDIITAIEDGGNVDWVRISGGTGDPLPLPEESTTLTLIKIPGVEYVVWQDANDCGRVWGKRTS